MRSAVFLAIPALIAATATARADKPLAEAAASLEKRLPAGCLVTGESIDGKRAFGLSGKAEPDGIPAEKRIFEIGSISKVFTGLLLADAVERKKVRLDSTLKELLGKKQEFAHPKVASITLLQLATHTSGLPRLPDNMGLAPDKDPYGSYDRKKMRDYLAKATLPGPPPHPAAYSNFGMGLLGDLLAESYGKTWGEAVKERITGPLGMKDTVVSLSKEQLTRLAPPYQGKEAGSSWTFQAMAGAGALRSTAADMLIFGEALIDPDKTKLAPAIRSMMQARAPYEDLGGEIGLGIILGRLDGEREYTHDGGTGGYRSALQVIPGRKLVRVVLVNNDDFGAGAALAAVREEARPANGPEKKLTGEELGTFTGVYDIGPGTRFTVLRREDRLWVRLTGQPFFPVAALEKEDRFRYKAVAAELQFQRKEGRVESLVLHQNGREIPATRSDAKLPEIIFSKEDDLKEFEGEYDLAPGQVITVKVVDDTLVAELTGQPPFPVFQTKPGIFEYDVVEASLEFEKDGNGKVNGLILHQNGDQRAKKK